MLTTRQRELFEHCHCDQCPLFHDGKRNPVFGTGREDARLVLVDESPKRQEAQNASQLDRSDRLLNHVLTRAGTSREDVYIAHTVLCRTVDDATGRDTAPDDRTIVACRDRLHAELNQFDADSTIVVAMGATATRALDVQGRNISEMQGSLQHVGGRWIMPAYLPSYVLRKSSEYPPLQDAFTRSVEYVGVPGDDKKASFPEKNQEFPYIHVTPDMTMLAMDICYDISHGKWGYELAIDVETSSVSNRSSLLQVAIANTERAVVFDAEVFFGTAIGGQAYDYLYDALSNKGIRWIMHNMSFDLQFIKRELGPHWSEMTTSDTMCYAFALNEDAQFIGLKYLSRKYCAAPYYEDALKPYLKNSKTPYSVIPRPVLAKYAAADVVYTARLYPILYRTCEKAGVLNLVHDLLEPAQRTFSDMEFDGCTIDMDAVDIARQEYGPRLQDLDKQIFEYAVSQGWDEPVLSPSSPQQLARFFYDTLKLRTPPRTKATEKRKSDRATGTEFRDFYRGKGKIDDLIVLLDERALVYKMLRTYVEGIADDISPTTGRIHPSFFIAGTVSGRITIKDPPLQTIPRDSTTGKSFLGIRSLFVPARLPDDDPGFEPVFVAADYSQLELRMAWLLSGDEAMGAALLDGDFHANTAARIYKIPVEEVTKEQRHNTKYVTFGIAYGRGAASLAAGELKYAAPSGNPNDALPFARDFITNWSEVYHVYWALREQWVLDVIGSNSRPARTGYLKTPFDRYRRFPFFGNDEDKIHAKNQALSFPTQSVAADLTTYNMIRIDNFLRTEGLGRVLFTVHDSIECEVDGRQRDDIVHQIHTMMLELPPQLEEIKPKDFALGAEIGWGRNWAECDENIVDVGNVRSEILGKRWIRY